MAIKEHILKCGTSTIKNKVTLNEIAMLWNLQHNNIVSYQGCAVVQSSLIIMYALPSAALCHISSLNLQIMHATGHSGFWFLNTDLRHFF